MYFKLLKTFLILVGIIQESLGGQQNLQNLKLDPIFMNVLNGFKKLERKMPAEHVRTIATLGLVNGAIEAEKDLEKHLTEKVADLILNLDMKNSNETVKKIDKIEKMIERDRSAIKILASSLDLARKSITVDEYRHEMKKSLKDYVKRQKEAELIKDNIRISLQDRLENLKDEVLEHMALMKNTIGEKSSATISFLETKMNKFYDETKIKKIDSNRMDYMTEHNLKSPVQADSNTVRARRQADDAIEPIEFEDFNDDKKELSNDNDDKNGTNKTAKQEEPGKSGGLAAIIAGLSGGEEGSDVGALVGALTGVVAQLFGPNGVDVPTLISSGTSLISGLLSGGRNFGIVLGEYVSLAFDGFSGGGGAENNGVFLGNLLGTIFAELSADPEDDDEPPKPDIFLRNFIGSFMKAKNKQAEIESDDENSRDSKEKDKGSDSFGFIKHILEAAVNSLTGVILNASLGSSSGASKGSSSLSKASSSFPKGSSGEKKKEGIKGGHGGGGGGLKGGHKFKKKKLSYTNLFSF